MQWLPQGSKAMVDILKTADAMDEIQWLRRKPPEAKKNTTVDTMVGQNGLLLCPTYNIVEPCRSGIS